MYTLQTKQMDGVWLSHDDVYEYLHSAINVANVAEYEYGCPKRVINENGDILYTVGDTPEYAEFVRRCWEHIEMPERPTAWQSRLNTWLNNTQSYTLYSKFEDEAIQYIQSFPLPTAPMHELVVSDLLGMYMMGEEL